MIRNGLQETLLIEKYMMQNYVDGRREENDLLMCLFTYIYKTCKISLEGYKRNMYPWLPLREKTAGAKGWSWNLSIIFSFVTV